MTVKKWLYPFLTLFVSYLLIALVALILPDPRLVLLTIGVVVGLIIPFFSFWYGKRYLSLGKNKYLFSLYNALVITLPYVILGYNEEETYIYAAIVFVWSVIWTVLALVIPSKKAKMNK